MLAAQGQETAPSQTHLHRWHLPTLQAINGPENSQVRHAVLITASIITAVQWAVLERAGCWHADTPSPVSLSLPIHQPTSFMYLEQVTLRAASTASTAVHHLCLGAGASHSTNSVHPGADTISGWAGASLQQASTWYCLHSTRKQQNQLCGNSDVLKDRNSDLDYDPTLNGHQLLTQGKTSALPTQASVSASNVSDGRGTNNVLLLLNFAILFCGPQCWTILHTKLCVHVCIYTIIYRLISKGTVSMVHILHKIPAALRQQLQHNPDNIFPGQGSILF